MHYLKKKYNEGISLVEVVISAAILLVFLTAITNVYLTFIKTATDGTEEIKSYYLAEEGIEAVKTLRDGSWASNIETLSTTTDYYLEWSGTAWLSTETEQVVDGFYRTFTVTDAFRDGNDDLAVSGTFDPDTRKLQVDVSWSKDNATTTESIETYITNIFDN
jgi:Tfp pilus assembly protein PilV